MTCEAAERTRPLSYWFLQGTWEYIIYGVYGGNIPVSRSSEGKPYPQMCKGRHRNEKWPQCESATASHRAINSKSGENPSGKPAASTWGKEGIFHDKDSGGECCMEQFNLASAERQFGLELSKRSSRNCALRTGSGHAPRLAWRQCIALASCGTLGTWTFETQCRGQQGVKNP